MFTGLIEEIGSVLSIRATKRGTQLQIAASQIANGIHARRESVSVNGCCLTVKSHRAENVTFDLLEETIERTNLKTLRRDSRVNLERALSADARLGGHFVQGHIDYTARVLSSGGNRKRSPTRSGTAVGIQSLRCGERFHRGERHRQPDSRGNITFEFCVLDHSAHSASHQPRHRQTRATG